MVESIKVRRAKLEEIIDLRHRVLRAGLPRETAIFPGDELTTTRNFGVFVRRDAIDIAVCCASFHLNSWEDRPAWQLRGMATDDAFRGRGLGRQLLELAEREILADAALSRQLWCNARQPAIRFYVSNGWKVVSAVFEIPTAGPHVRMTRRIGSSASD